MTNTPDGLEVRDLQRIFGGSRTAGAIGLTGVSFKLEPGTFFTLLGPSGCGKTTTLRCVAGLEVPDSGAITLGDTPFFNSADDTNVPLHRRNIGMVFQSYAIWPHMTVGQNVAFPLKMSRTERLGPAEMRQRVLESLDLVGLTGFVDRHPFQLSGGQQQRVALARALVRKPRLLLLDEPLSNLDAVLREEMRSELRRLQKRLGVTTIYVTHDQTEALEMSDLIGVMDRGQLVQLASPEEVYFSPSNLFVAKFMGASNLLEGKVAAAANGDGIGAVALADGRILQSRLAPALDGIGSAVRIYLRPEALTVQVPGTSVQNANVIEGEVVSTSFLGHSRRVRVDIGGTVVEATAETSTRVDDGQRIAVAFAHGDTVALAATPSN